MSQQVAGQNIMLPSWLNKDFIQTALRAGDEDPKINVVSVDFSMANVLGDGVGSDMYRAIAKLDNSQERRVIVKCEPKGAAREEFIKKTDMFKKEIKMLSETLPAMCRLLKQAKPSDCRPLSAKCLYHGKDPVQFIVLEDLRQSGFTLANRRLGLDLPHCKLALKELARLHATSLVLLEQDPTAFQTYESPLYTEKLRNDLGPFFQTMIQKIEDLVLKWPGFEKFSEKIRKIRENVYDIFMQQLAARDGELKTLIHADAWPGNMMFKYSDSEVTDIRLVDFQLSYYSTPAVDIQHFLADCPNEEVREKWTDSLIEGYHTAFSEILDKLNCQNYKITLEKLKKDIDAHFLYGLIIASVYLPLTLSDPTEEWDLNDILTKGGDTVHNNTEDILSSGVYEKIMKKLLLKWDSLDCM